MKLKLFISLTYLFFSIDTLIAQKQYPLDLSRSQSFNSDWKFKRGDQINAESPSFDDSKWRPVDLPHDWSIEDLPNQSVKEGIIGPFSRESRPGNGYTVGGYGWYRKTFVLNNAESKNVEIRFDGVYMASDVFINGHFLGEHPYGYTPFQYKIDSYLKKDGSQNVLAVRIKNRGSNTRWYSGSGIYRDVELTITNKIAIRDNETKILTQLVNPSKATVTVSSVFKNYTGVAEDVNLKYTIIRKGKEVASFSQKGINLVDTIHRQAKIEVSNPELWDLETPNLYTARLELLDKNNNTVLDKNDIEFGIRTISVSPESGFLLMENGLFYVEVVYIMIMVLSVL